MMRPDAGGELAHLMARQNEIARAAERAREQRRAHEGRSLRRGRVRTAAIAALWALVVRLEPARERRLGRDAGG